MIMLDDVMNAENWQDVAVYFLAWLDMPKVPGGDKKRLDPRNHRKYALHLTEEYVSRMHEAELPSYNLYLYRGGEQVSDIIRILMRTAAFTAAQGSNGGNGVFQAAFGKLQDFWSSLENGEGIPEELLDNARQKWAGACEWLASH
ncbi:MAG: hypothetical protein IKO72_13530 [Kiritimatiellae bacterium]|nr:hypothetical protein [Kiritimatiellia bacterium]